MVRKMFVDRGAARRTAESFMESGKEVQVWMLRKKDGSERIDVLFPDETPKGEGWEMLYALVPAPSDE